MADQRDGGITWTDETWNVVRGCSRVSEACRFCYAERIAATRLSGPGQPYEGLAVRTSQGPRWTGKVQLVESLLDQPSRWRRPRRIFVNAMSDLFHQQLTFADIDRVVVEMILANWHLLQVLTKRVRRMREYLTDPATRERLADLLRKRGRHDMAMAITEGLDIGGPSRVTKWPIPNVMWGGTMEDQGTFDSRITDLLACRQDARYLWTSMEPLLGPVDIRRAFPAHYAASTNRGLDCVVVGGEHAGPDEDRPMLPAWVRDIRDVTIDAGAMFHFKQWGGWAPGVNVERISGIVQTATWTGSGWALQLEDLAQNIGHADDEPDMYRVGKKAAGRLLDGRTWDDMPAWPAEG